MFGCTRSREEINMSAIVPFGDGNTRIAGVLLDTRTSPLAQKPVHISANFI